MVHTEFVKGMAVGLMRAWNNARQISRVLNIHHKSFNGGGRDGETAKGQ